MSYEINTFVGLGSPGLDSKEEYRLQYRRADITAKFIKEQDCDMSVVLDVAGPSEIGKAICRRFSNDKMIAGTSGDLDGVWWSQTGVVQTVIMTEVLEHILNPLKFMKELKEAVHEVKMDTTARVDKHEEDEKQYWVKLDTVRRLVWIAVGAVTIMSALIAFGLSALDKVIFQAQHVQIPK